jgi:DNA-binding transcriptional LysR family regulator
VWTFRQRWPLRGGIAALPDFLVAGRSDLVQVKAREPLVTREIWMAVHTDMKNAAPIRAVWDALREDGAGC